LAVSVGIRVEAESTSKSLGDLSDKEDLYLDIGARNETDAKKYLEPGMVARYDSKPIRLGNDQIVTPYADNLMSCCALLSAMEQVSNQSSPNDLYFLFTAQEEVGLRGARAAAFKLRPDYCIVLDGTHTADCPSDTRKYGSKLGGGAALKISDSSFISNRQVTDHLRRIALAENILWQDDIMQGGGTDGQAFQSAPGGVLTSGISIPMRNIHSPYETVSEADVKAVAKLISIVALSDFSSVK
jgi:putative aminopeptidase FrvX